jgi:hypothetical protein
MNELSKWSNKVEKMNEIQRMLLSSVTFLIQPAKNLLVVSLVKFCQKEKFGI